MTRQGVLLVLQVGARCGGGLKGRVRYVGVCLLTAKNTAGFARVGAQTSFFRHGLRGGTPIDRMKEPPSALNYAS